MPSVPALPNFAALTGASVPVRIVDVGANPIDGTPPYERLLREGEASLIGFEPNPEALARLQDLKGARETYLPHAIGDGQLHALHICNAPGMTSLLTPDPEVLRLFHGFPSWGHVKDTLPVATVRLDDIAETQGAELLKIDIQGGELMAMQNAESMLASVLVIQTEVEFMPLYQGQPLFSDIDQFLRARGFMLHRFYPTVSRVVAPMLVNDDIYAGMSQLVWADAIFIRDITRLGALSAPQLLATAAILHDCYESLDVVLLLLTEHDRRSGGGLAAAYLANLQPRPETEAASPAASLAA